MSWAVLGELDFEVVGSDQSVACDAFERVARVVALGDATVMSDDELLGAVRSIERGRRSADAAEAHVLAELESRGLTDERRGLRTGQWVAHETCEPVRHAVRRVSVATRMRADFAPVDQAFSEGRIGWFHVEALVDTSNERIAPLYLLKVPGLIDLAQTMAFEPWRKVVRDTACRLDFDGGYRPEDDPHGARASLGVTGDITYLHAIFPGATGAEIRQIVDTRTDRIWRQLQTDNKTSNGAIKVPPRDVIRGLAIAELLRDGHTADPTRTTAPTTDLTLILRLDVSDLFGGGLTPTSGTTTGGADLRSFIKHGWYDQSRHYETSDGCEICATTIEHRLCDAAISVLLTDEDGAALYLGRSQRLASPEQRRAARARDRGCVFPGCDRPATWCDCHHVNEWDHGGTTDITHLACLCRFHHGVTHRTGWTMHATPDQWFWWHTPHGDTFWSQRGQQQRAGPTPNAP